MNIETKVFNLTCEMRPKFFQKYVFCLLALMCSMGVLNTEGNEKKINLEGHPSSLPISSEVIDQGRILYNIHCAHCHFSQGEGLPGVFPPLRASELIVNKPEVLVSIVLLGIQGPISVKGEVYNGVMPPQNIHAADLLKITRYMYRTMELGLDTLTDQAFFNLVKNLKIRKD